MRIELINEPNPSLSTVDQILINRGIPKSCVKSYTHLTDDVICDFETLGMDKITAALDLLKEAINNSLDCAVIVDSDCDGFASAALLINYLYDLAPTWAAQHINWFMHSGKQHGLNDQMDNLMPNGCCKYQLVFVPDGGSNDFDAHYTLKTAGCNVIVLDHHLADKVSEDAIIINNQLSDYPNKEACGACITWQFCRAIDKIYNRDYSDKYIDIVALALCGDMMSLKSWETRRLITKGFEKKNIKNPFIDYMLDKNSFPLSKPDYVSSNPRMACTSMGAAFFIVPFVNAITRTGTMEEKDLIFKSMLNHYAFNKIPEIKRNKKTGKEEYLVLQAVRVIGNVKNRQTREEQKGVENLESKIQEYNMLDHGALFFKLKQNEINSGVRGLVANKLMSKYMRPCIITTESNETLDGSMRGYTKNGLDDFKSLLQTCPGVNFVQGHHNAAGISIQKSQLHDFLVELDARMADYPPDPTYKVDYIFEYYYFNHINTINPTRILDIAGLNDLWGQDIERAHIGIKCQVLGKNITLMKSNTIKIQLPNTSMIMFGATDEQVQELFSAPDGWLEIKAYCKCNTNEWNGNLSAQLIIEDYEITSISKYIF